MKNQGSMDILKEDFLELDLELIKKESIIDYWGMHSVRFLGLEVFFRPWQAHMAKKYNQELMMPWKNG